MIQRPDIRQRTDAQTVLRAQGEDARQRLQTISQEKIALEAERTAKSRAGQEMNETLLNLERAASRLETKLTTSAMEEKQITVDGVTSRLAEPFMVLATQNPLESFGTFPLPDAQMDRFFMRLSLGYMNREQEMEVLSRPSAQAVLSQLNPVVTPEETAYVRTAYREVKVSDDVKNYLMDIVEATRMQGGFVSGVSTRGALALYQAAQAYAALQGRDYVAPEDVKGLAPAVLCHRVVLGGSMNAEAATQRLRKLLSDVEVPLENH